MQGVQRAVPRRVPEHLPGPVAGGTGSSTPDRCTHPGRELIRRSFTCNVTITGPEWDFSTVAAPTVQIGADGSGTPIFARDRNNNNHALFFAFIYDGAVAVYERTVRLEGPSMWSN